MAIRTITIIHEYFIALQGYWRWNELSGFHLISLRIPRLDTIFNDPPAFTPPPHHPTLTPGSPSGMYTGEMGSVDDLEPATSESSLGVPEDDLDSSVDSSLSSVEIDPPLRLHSRQHNCGLGISGLLAKDGSGPFTGLGVVSVRSFLWRHTSTTTDSQRAAEEETMLWMMVNTTLQSGFNHNTDITPHTPELNLISKKSENGPESLEALQLVAKPLPTCPPVTPTKISLPHTISPLLSKTNFAAPTISSELKKITKTSSTTSSPPRNRCHRIYGSQALVLANPSRFHGHQTQKIHDVPTRRSFLAPKTTAYMRPRAPSVGPVNVSKSVRLGSPELAAQTIPRWR
jgi:hypothetical protein